MAGYRAKKRLGQHFLISSGVIQETVDLVSPEADDTIVEIGPGRGALTVPLAQSGARVVAVEFDRDVYGYVKALLEEYPRAEVVCGDFLTFDPKLHGLLRFKLIGNLPYNLTSPVLDRAVALSGEINLAVFMVQRELAVRVAAAPGGKDWSPLSIFTQLAFAVEQVFDVSPEHFRPPPQVTSSVIRLVPHQSPTVVPPSFETVVRAAFRHRRKQLANNLVPEVIERRETFDAVVAQLGWERNCRAEQISINGFLKLTEAIEAATMR